MNTTHVQMPSTIQNTANSKAASVLDSSSQSEVLQRKADMANNAAQRAEAPRPNNTGMPDNLKAGIESLSGFSMDEVRVHYNSSKPATVQALAFTQGTDIHVPPGQEKHLPHEAWHVAQQMAGRVSPTTNINGMPVNDNAGLEHEADVMGEKAVQCKKNSQFQINSRSAECTKKNICQRVYVLNAYSFFSMPQDLAYETVVLKKTFFEYLIGKVSSKSLTRNIIEKFAPICAANNITDRLTIIKEASSRLRYTPEHIADVLRNQNYDDVIGLDPVFGDIIPLGINETLVLSAHGTIERGRGIATRFANLTPQDLANRIFQILPDNYRGEIYLFGCHTADGGANSYIKAFKAALIQLNGVKNVYPTVRGHIGEIAVGIDKDLSTLEQKTQTV